MYGKVRKALRDIFNPEDIKAVPQPAIVKLAVIDHVVLFRNAAVISADAVLSRRQPPILGGKGALPRGRPLQYPTGQRLAGEAEVSRLIISYTEYNVQA